MRISALFLLAISPFLMAQETEKAEILLRNHIVSKSSFFYDNVSCQRIHDDTNSSVDLIVCAKAIENECYHKRSSKSEKECFAFECLRDIDYYERSLGSLKEKSLLKLGVDEFCFVLLKTM